MRTMTTSTSSLWGRVLRLLLGGVLLASGIGKLLDEAGFVDVLRTYQLGLPDVVLWPLALAVSAVETVAGSLILLGRRLYLAAWVALAINFVYFLVLSASLLRGLELANCGCFGVYAARPLRWYSPIEDVALMAASLLLARLSARDGRG